MNKKIKVLVVEPYKEPYEIEILNTLERFQEIVGGNIEYLNIENDINLICNEEGKIYRLPINRRVGNDTILGTFIITKGDLKTGEDVSLNNNEIIKYTKMFKLNK